jgi:hypothetical protein
MAVSRPGSIPSEKIRDWVELQGAKDGVNTVFTTPESFIETSNIRIKVFVNGIRQDVDHDYTVSGGPTAGTGNTLTFLFTPKSSDKLFADYIAV